MCYRYLFRCLAANFYFVPEQNRHPNGRNSCSLLRAARILFILRVNLWLEIFPQALK